MPRTKIIDTYVAGEILAPFGLGVLLLTFALVTARLLKLTEMVVNHGVSLSAVGSLIGFIMPAFLELTFPMAVLLGVLMGFGRMSGDRELIAARACGISLYRLALPVLGVAFAVYAVSSWLAFSVRPWANRNLEQRIFDLTRTTTSAGLREKVFNRDFPGLVVYVDTLSPADGSLHGVMISDARNPTQRNTIIARRGIIIPDEASKSITLRLYDGSLFGVEAERNSSHVTSFRTYDLNVHPEEGIELGRRSPDQMSYRQLRQTIVAARFAGQPDYEAETELATKFTVPFTTLLFALMGVPLGLKPARGGQSERFGLAIALFFLYYSLMRAGEALAERARVNAFFAMSIPDLIFAALALWLFLRSATDTADQGRGAGDFLWDLVERFERRREVGT
jgi:lipopolysaccharide export system permease protein